MWVIDPILYGLGTLVVLAPLSLVILLGVPSLVDRPLSERSTTRILEFGTLLGLGASVLILVEMLASGTRFVPIRVGNWVAIPGLYRFSLTFVFDRLSVPFVILSFVLSGTIGAFATRYLHRERGFNRFFVLYSLFLLGMVVTSLAGTGETLFTGWELVGLSSALLVGYYQSRSGPSRNGLWVWSIYRVSDAALLIAVVATHHLVGEGDINQMLGAGVWPYELSAISPGQALLVGSLFLLAAAGKSALIPFSGWLPRAMEGPTPSSAVFYGALSVHLGVFLLLRMSPLIARSPALAGMVVALGVGTALAAYLAGLVQTDIKSALSYASLTQVGIIVAEIGLLHYIPLYVPLVHMLGHACVRTLQFLRAPTLLRDYLTIENAIGDHLPQSRSPLERLANGRCFTWFYRVAIERAFLDTFLSTFVVVPFQRVFRLCDRVERRWTDMLAGGVSRPSDTITIPFGAVDENS